MSDGREGWLSRDPIERRDSLRRVVKRLIAEHDLDEAHVSRMVGVTPRRFNVMMKLGERMCPPAGDLSLLSSVLGGEDQLLREIASSRGYRLVREDAAVGHAADILAAAARVVSSASALFASASAAAAGPGVHPEQARAISRDCETVHRAVGLLEAQVSYAVEPIAIVKGGR